jgi:hypothetical protein
MSDHSWTNVRNFFDPELMGPLPNVVIEGTRVEGRQTVFELLRSDGWMGPDSVRAAMIYRPDGGRHCPTWASSQPNRPLRLWPAEGPDVGRVEVAPHGHEPVPARDEQAQDRE